MIYPDRETLSPLGRVGVGWLLCLCLFSCAEIKPVTIGAVDNVHVKKLSTEGVDFTFTVNVKNPNSVGVNVFPAAFDANVNGIDVGKIKLDKKVRIKANSDGAPEFHIVSDFTKVSMADIAKIVSMVGSKNATVNLKGDVKVGKWYYKKKFPIDLKKSVNLSK